MDSDIEARLVGIEEAGPPTSALYREIEEGGSDLLL